MRSNFARFQIELDKKGAYQTRCWFTRGSSRLIVTRYFGHFFVHISNLIWFRIEEDRESLSYDLYNEVVPSNHEGNSGPLSLLSLVVCDSDTSFQVI